MDEEAEGEVVAGERGDVAREPVRSAQAPQHVAGEAGPLAVVADERHAPALQHAAGLGLGGVVQQRGEALAGAARQLVGQRLGEQRRDRRGELAAEADGLRVGLHRHDGVEHLERVAEHVGVVIRALLDAAQRLELGQDGCQQPVLLHQRQAIAHARGGDDALELGEHALGRHGVDRGGVLAHRGAGGGLDLEAELDREAHGAQRAQRVVAQGALGDHPQPPGREVLRAAVRVHDLAAAERLGHRVDGEVARGQIGPQVAVAQREQVDVPGVARADRAPAAELVRELERGPAGGLRDPPRRAARVALEGEVDVVGVAPEQAVADGAADEPRRLPRERGARHLQRRAHAGSPSRWCSRGTRRVIPHVIS